jgi:hypothetical protein
MACRHKLHNVSFVSPDVSRGLVLWERLFILKLLDKFNFDNKAMSIHSPAISSVPNFM